MTRQKTFKRRVRERMAKTGESYTAARRILIANGDRPETAAADFKPPVAEERMVEATGRADTGILVDTLHFARSGSTLSMSWGASCRPAADYVVQEGTLAALRTGTYDDVPLTCTTGGQTSHTAAVPIASAYFLVLPLDGAAVGSRGLNGAGAERPPGASGCAAPSTAAPVCP